MGKVLELTRFRLAMAKLHIMCVTRSCGHVYKPYGANRTAALSGSPADVLRMEQHLKSTPCARCAKKALL